MKQLRLRKTSHPAPRQGMLTISADEDGIRIIDEDGQEQSIGGSSGKSAYQIARDHGYGGTETQWLASLKGDAGDKGPTGDAGPDGAAGEAGPVGDKGATGDKGPQGEAGPAGDPGPNGAPGPDGQPGAAGATGDKGPTGDPGPAGQAGATGQTGATGDKGPVGDKGPTGDTGTKGATGDKGPVGDKGPTGDAGPAGSAPVYAVVAGTALALATNEVVSVSPTANTTYTTTVPAAGLERVVIVRQTTATSRTLTFGSGFKPTTTLATGTTTARVFVVSFISDGTVLYEKSRTAAMAA